MHLVPQTQNFHERSRKFPTAQGMQRKHACLTSCLYIHNQLGRPCTRGKACTKLVASCLVGVELISLSPASRHTHLSLLPVPRYTYLVPITSALVYTPVPVTSAQARTEQCSHQRLLAFLALSALGIGLFSIRTHTYAHTHYSCNLPLITGVQGHCSCRGLCCFCSLTRCHSLLQ